MIEKNEEIDSNEENHGSKVVKDKSTISKIRKVVMMSLKVVAVLAIVFFVAYMYKYSGKTENPVLQLSNQEIVGDTQESLNQFNLGESVYFRLDSKKKLGKNVAIVQIDHYRKSSFQYYKKITYEIDSDFKEVESMLSANYFKIAGKYRIKILIDGFSPIVREFTVVASQQK